MRAPPASNSSSSRRSIGPTRSPSGWAPASTTSRLLADVAEDLRQLSRVNRETVERHVQLAAELAKVGQIIEQTATQPRPVAAAPEGEAPTASEPKVSDGLMRALRELQTEAE